MPFNIRFLNAVYGLLERLGNCKLGWDLLQVLSGNINLGKMFHSENRIFLFGKMSILPRTVIFQQRRGKRICLNEPVIYLTVIQ